MPQILLPRFYDLWCGTVAPKSTRADILKKKVEAAAENATGQVKMLRSALERWGLASLVGSDIDSSQHRAIVRSVLTLDFEKEEICNAV